MSESGNSNPNQVNQVIAYMRKHGSITQGEALLYLSVARLPSRISEMKKAGIAIKKDWVFGKNQFGKKTRFMRYSFDEDESDE